MSVPKAVIDEARRALSARDPALARANEVIPPFEWREKERGFSGLVGLIIEQQVSVAAARAIWKKLEEGLGFVGVKEVLAKDIDQLKTYGLSGPKARYVRGVAEALASGQIDLEALRHLDDDAASEKLMALHGIGRWTAEAYLMGCEARTDVFPAADIALQEAIRILDGKASRPTTEELYERSELWRPFRSIAAHLLWAYYSAVKDNAIAMPPGVPPIVAKPLPKKKSKKTKTKNRRGNVTQRAKTKTKGTR